MITTSIFLVPNATLIVEIVAFLVVLFVVGRYVVPVLDKALSERQEKIRSSLESADRARSEAEETRSQRQGILDEARAQAREIIAQANRSAEQARTDGLARGQDEHDRLVASAESEILASRQRAVADLGSQVGRLVLAAARQVVGREIDAERHRDLIDEAVEALRASAEGRTVGASAGAAEVGSLPGQGES